MNRPSTKELSLRAEEYALQFQDGLITEAEWVSKTIDLFLQHHGNMRAYTMQQAMEWQPTPATNP